MPASPTANLESGTANGIAVYVHIPFCPSKCGYCDFNSYGVSQNGKPGLEPNLVPRTVEATVQDIRRNGASLFAPAKTIFFGGGTPTSLEASQIRQILGTVFEIHPPVQKAEITSEANPGTADAEKFESMREAGFNRISLGAQSFSSTELRQLGRIHGPDQIANAVSIARNAGFENLNLDLMFGLPHQTLGGWRDNLLKAIDLGPDHLSLYCLTIEPRTAFKRMYDSGKLHLPSDTVQTEMYDLAREIAAENGYHQYEISNFAKPNRACQHNLEYWRGAPYAGYGPGAVGCLPGNAEPWVRTTRLLHPRRYCEAIENHENPNADEEHLASETVQTERIMLGLRLNEGLNVSIFSGDPAKSKGVQIIIERGWGEVHEDHLSLTRLGQDFCSDATLLLI